jgi:methionyl-tRNA formyltransferase
MQEYFSGVMAAEQEYFGHVRFSPRDASIMSIRAGDLNRLTERDLSDALNADVYVVFGSSFIKGWLADYLVQHQALNIHMGLSPYYRGSSCNFWAVYDGNPAMVGATIHLLTHGLDSGPILRHAVPSLADENSFLFTMKAVVAAFDAITETVAGPTWRNSMPIDQDKSLELRYSRNADFTDEIASDFLSRRIGNLELREMLAKSAKPKLMHPVTV